MQFMKHLAGGTYKGVSKYVPSMGSFYALSATNIKGEKLEFRVRLFLQPLSASLPWAAALCWQRVTRRECGVRMRIRAPSLTCFFQGRLTLDLSGEQTDSGYKALVEMHSRLKDRGFRIFAFPCNQFGGQESKPENEVAEFCERKYQAKFDMMSKIDVNGPNTDPVYAWLKTAFPGDM